MFHGGEQVGSYRKYDERLTCFLLTRRNMLNVQTLGRYGAASEYWSERWDRMLDLIEHGSSSGRRRTASRTRRRAFARRTIAMRARRQSGTRPIRRRAVDPGEGRLLEKCHPFEM